MSGSMEIAMLSSDQPEQRMTWKDVDYQKWLKISDKCPAQSAGQFCFISDEPCNYDHCFGRY